MALRSGYKGIKKLAAGLKWNRPGILAADDIALAEVFFPRSEQAVLGAKNLAVINRPSTTYTGITFTVEEDGISASGIATADAFFKLTTSPVKLPVGTLILNGAPSGSSLQTYGLKIADSPQTKQAFDVGSGVSFTTEENKVYEIMCFVANGTNLSTPIKFKPMFSFDGGEYAPPAMTNKELTDAFHKLFKRVVYTSTEPIEVAANGYADVNIDSVSGYQILTKNSTLSGSGSSAYGYVSVAGGSNVVRFVNRDSSSHTWNYEIAVWYIANDAFS